MTCPDCGQTAPADPETGYDADDRCPACQAAHDGGVRLTVTPLTLRRATETATIDVLVRLEHSGLAWPQEALESLAHDLTTTAVATLITELEDAE